MTTAIDMTNEAAEKAIPLSARDVVLLWGALRERARRAEESSKLYAGYGSDDFLVSSYAEEAKEARRLAELLIHAEVLVQTR